jgi:quinol monooxygenase YgiN
VGESDVIGIEILIRVDEAKRVEFQQLCTSLASAERAPGCMVRAAFADNDDPGRYLWLERWEDEQLLLRHLDSERHHTLLGAIRVLGALEDLRIVRFSPADSAD